MNSIRLVSLRFLTALVGLGFLHSAPAPAQTLWSVTRPAASFDRSALTRPEFAQKIKAGGTLSGAKGDWGITGSVEYDIDIPRSGWYELTVRGSGREVQYLIDPDPRTMRAARSVYGSTGNSLTADKIGNFWFAAGRHTLRLQRYFWTGLPAIESLTITAASPALAKSMYAVLAGEAGIYRLNECAPLEVFFGGRGLPAVLNIWFKDASGKLLRVESLAVPQSSEPVKQSFVLPCNEPGTFTIGFGESGREIAYGDVHTIGYEVMDTAHPGGSGDPTGNGTSLTKTLVEEIDCAKVIPDFYGGGETRIGSTSSGSLFRESGDVGFTRYQRAPSDAVRKSLPEPSWFAYRLHSVVPQKPYVVEVDYPDDRLRTFAIALRESAPLSYPVAGGVDSGGEFSVSNQMHTETLLYWPRAEGTRVTLLNAHDGRRAAASKIRVYRLDEPLPPLVPQGTAGRQFLNWYEEGNNFLSMYGAINEYVEGQRAATGRWAEAVRYAGGTVLAPTVSIYSFALYPSRYNLAFSKPDTDYLRRILLEAEQRGLKVLPELHPRADELSWPYVSAADPKPHLLVSRDGKTTSSLPPLFNPLYPANQDWYVGMIGELVDAYRDSPALLGVNLRLMQWTNPALNNFQSLDWGYDDYTVKLFAQETGSAVPLGAAGDPSRFAGRYNWLMANARVQWIDWRCRKIAGIYTRIRDRVRQARPDLKVYSSVFQWEQADAPLDALRGAGIDPAMLRGIPGIELINATHTYGRKESDALATQPTRDALLDPQNLAMLSGSGAAASFLTSANYIEATEAIVPPPLLGFPANTKLTWMSATANPAGRHHMERFAVQLAETDAGMLGDGGNAYSLGQPVLREFLAEYLRLPPEPFSRRPDASDPVAVWEKAAPGAFLFYAVNRERYPVTVRISLSAGAKLVRLVDGSAVDVKDNSLQFVLKPYQLIAFRAASSARIRLVDVQPPPAQRDRVAGQVRWLQDLEKVGAKSGRLNEPEKAQLRHAAGEAADALSRGHLWHARTLIERAQLLAIYRKLDRFPPQSRDE